MQTRKPHSSLLARVGICLLVGIAGGLLTLTGLARMNRSPLSIAEPATTLLPGNPKPASAKCAAFYDVGLGVDYCTVSQTGLGTVSFTYDRRQHAIFYTRYTPQNVRVGDLLLAWGIPTTYAREGRATELFWRQRAALITTPLQPDSSVVFISYYPNRASLPLPQREWRSFSVPDN